MKRSRAGIALGVLLVVSAAIASRVSSSWPWQSRRDRFCEAIREIAMDPALATPKGLLELAAAAPAEIAADMKFVAEFQSALLTRRFPYASGPGAGLLTLNPDFLAAQERIGAYLRRECEIGFAAANAEQEPPP